eukprot:TRINITY_DN7051_c0_g1_i1.p1 TRINITY_DN7051_c0_g1~~TRINITY_DN7051_c0_g1_i1.p1  ORF type:complete len:215 (-),score=-15.11 TRINITY_DN7051_c0_g1_i1:336-980(-)
MVQWYDVCNFWKYFWKTTLSMQSNLQYWRILKLLSFRVGRQSFIIYCSEVYISFQTLWQFIGMHIFAYFLSFQPFLFGDLFTLQLFSFRWSILPYSRTFVAITVFITLLYIRKVHYIYIIFCWEIATQFIVFQVCYLSEQQILNVYDQNNQCMFGHFKVFRVKYVCIFLSSYLQQNLPVFKSDRFIKNISPLEKVVIVSPIYYTVLDNQLFSSN